MIRGYHITYLDKLQSIMSRGLRIDADGWLAGYVWFWDDHDVAMGMTSMWDVASKC